MSARKLRLTILGCMTAILLLLPVGAFGTEKAAGHDETTGETKAESANAPSAPEMDAHTVYWHYLDGTVTLTSDPEKKELGYGTFDASAQKAGNCPWTSETAKEAFLSDIKRVVILDDIHPVSTRYWFRGCENLTQIEGMQNLDTSAVTSMRGMFRDCKNLKAIDLSHFSTTSVKSFRGMFRECSQLTELDVTSFKVSEKSRTDRMFRGCTSLKVIYASPEATWTPARGTNMFGGCSALRGGQGTVCDPSADGYSRPQFARADGGEEAPGYFTAKTAKDKTTEENSAKTGPNADSPSKKTESADSVNTTKAQ